MDVAESNMSPGVTDGGQHCRKPSNPSGKLNYIQSIVTVV